MVSGEHSSLGTPGLDSTEDGPPPALENHRVVRLLQAAPDAIIRALVVKCLRSWAGILMAPRPHSEIL